MYQTRQVCYFRYTGGEEEHKCEAVENPILFSSNDDSCGSNLNHKL